MDLSSDIEKATHISWEDDEARFLPLQELSQAEKDRRKNRRKIKVPRNINLLENDEEPYERSENHIFNEHEIAASIKAVNGGADYSNEFLEKQWQSKFFRNCSSEEINNTSSTTTTSLSNSSSNNNINSESSENNNYKMEKVTDRSKEEEEDCENIDQDEALRRCRLSRNAAISGLLKQNKISVKDLQLPNNFDNFKKTDDVSATNASGKTETEDRDEINLVSHPEDPDTFVHPLQAYGHLDKRKCENIDFTVPHIGTKHTVTPKQFYLTEIDDSAFKFQRKKKVEKK